MVKDTRTSESAGAVRALNEPEPVEARTAERGYPLAVRLRRRWVKVEGIVDVWRVDDEWWREQPVRRMYFQCSVDKGLNVLLFRDLVTGRWYTQRT